ncbi:hypothetical protein [Marinobacterium sp. BA1]|uniref:hypothetical protein n=1 Tax=Marinobacterium sp. BA1 TaxID=3138931 RepID=UPI0032E7BB55
MSARKNNSRAFWLPALIGYAALAAYQGWTHYQIYIKPTDFTLEKVLLAIQPISASLSDMPLIGLITLLGIALWYTICKLRYPSHIDTMVTPPDADINVQIKVAQLNYLSAMRGTEADRVFAAGIFGGALGLGMYVMQMLLGVAPGAWIALHLAG